MKLKNADVHIGPAGWSYEDWKGTVYPDPEPPRFRPPAFLAQYFNAIEINTTFYHQPNPGYCYRWLKDVADRKDFLFTVKLWQGFTHEQEIAGVDARPTGEVEGPHSATERAGSPAEVRRGGRRRQRWTEHDVELFRSCIGPLVKAGRLGALLMQFPWSFRHSPDSEDYLRELVGKFSDMPLVLEVRHKGWLEHEAIEFIESLGVGFCNIDQPAFAQNLPLTTFGFGPVGYLRLHGRNYENWFARGAGRDARYDYLYKAAELDEIQAAMEKIAERVERMFVIANNHYRGQAVATGIQLIERLTGEHIEPPGNTKELYGLT
jgi:uncharacterized protein YecE (DUF72 family)